MDGFGGLGGFMFGITPEMAERELNARRAYAETSCEVIPEFVEELIEEMDPGMCVKTCIRKEDGDPPYVGMFVMLTGDRFDNEDVELIVRKAWSHGLEVETSNTSMDGGMAWKCFLPYKSPLAEAVEEEED